MIARGKALKKEGASIERDMGIAPEIATFDLNEHSPDSGGGPRHLHGGSAPDQAAKMRRQFFAITASLHKRCWSCRRHFPCRPCHSCGRPRPQFRAIAFAP